MPRPQLQIVRSGDQLELSWLDPYQAFRLETTECLGSLFYGTSHVPNYVGDRATVIVEIDPGYPGTSFYRLALMPSGLSTE